MRTRTFAGEKVMMVGFLRCSTRRADGAEPRLTSTSIPPIAVRHVQTHHRQFGKDLAGYRRKNKIKRRR
jgi:hypothetical protein